MPIDLSWFLQGKIIHVIVEGDIVLEDVSQLSESIQVYFEQSNSPLVHILINKGNMQSIPKSLKSLSEVTKFMRDAQLGWFIIYGNMEHEKIAVFFSTVITGMAKVRYRRFDTLEESLAFMASVDSTLPTVEAMLSD